MKRARHSSGSVVLDKRRKVWNYLYCDQGVRRTKRIGALREFRTKAQAQEAAERIRQTLSAEKVIKKEVCTVSELVQRYEVERIPQRSETNRVYRSFLRNHIVPRWGSHAIADLQPRAVELWLRELQLSPKSKTHIRNLLHVLFDFAMWSGVLDLTPNPIDLVVVRGASKRIRKARNLTVEQFRVLWPQLHEPFRTMALLCVCFGLRISECLALRWADVDWLNGRLSIERGIVRQKVDDVKTDGSRKTFAIAPEVLQTLTHWRQETEFSSGEDWMFASPLKLGRLPYSYTGVWRELQRASASAGIGGLGTHAFRHTFRSWLDAAGTPIAVQQKLMRHSDIRTMLNIYGDVVTDEMEQASARVAGFALG